MSNLKRKNNYDDAVQRLSFGVFLLIVKKIFSVKILLQLCHLAMIANLGYKASYPFNFILL